MDLLVFGLIGLVLLFCVVVAFGAPYLPTLSRQAEDALDLLDLNSGQTMLELGCGDGRVLLAAAKRGVHSVGYEINPVLVVVARLMTWRYRGIVSVRWGNYWNANWPRADGIYVFLLDRYMRKLDTKVTQWQQGSVRVVSYAFAVPGRKPSKQTNGLFLYLYDDPRHKRRIPTS
jgi:SAM-dependent methyltransferase